MAKQKKKIKRDSDINFKFKTVLGIRPTTYVPLLYIIGIALILYIVLFAHGIKNNGSVVTFESNPSAASVKVDGIRVGATPCTVFVDKGLRTIEISKPGYTTETETIEIKGRIFATRFVPRKMEVFTFHKTDRFPEYLQNLFTDFTGWSYAGIPNRDFSKPRILSPMVNDYYLSEPGDNQEEKKLVRDFTIEAIPYLNNSFITADWLKSQLIMNGNGSVLTINSLYKTIVALNQLTTENPYAADQVANLVGENILQLDPISDDALFLLANKPLGSDISKGGLTFIYLPGDRYLMGNPEGDQVETVIEDFYLSSTEITNEQFYLFTRENTEWSPQNRAELLKKNLIDQSYLEQWTNGIPSNDILKKPVCNVSYFTAIAYCEWFSAKYLSGTNLQARLPYEKEWEYAAQRDFSYDKEIFTGELSDVDFDDPGSEGFHYLTGNLWEWNMDNYAPYGLVYPNIIPKYQAAAKSVRGGCFANNEPVSIFKRGSQPSEFCTPFLGFRVALVEKQE